MTRPPALMMLTVLATAPRASAACRWFGTQLECDVAASHVVIGTQAAEQPTRERAFPILSFQANRGFLDDQSVSPRPFEIQLQDVGADPRLCWRIGNETYCY